MATLVIGATLADAEDFCTRNPDFSDAVRASGLSRNRDGLIVEEFVLTPRAKQLRGTRREYIRMAGHVAARDLLRSWRGVGSRSVF